MFFFILCSSIRLIFLLSSWSNSDFVLFWRKEPDIQEEEITYVDLYDDEIKELMAKYDELDKQHKKKKKKKKKHKKHKKQKGEY